MSSTMDYIPAPIDYTSKKTVLPKTRFNRVPLNNTTSSSVVLTPTTTQLLEFKIPANSVFNLAKSTLQFSYVVPDLNAKYNFVHENPEFQNIQLATTSNVVLADVQNCHYSNFLLNRLNTKKQDLLAGSTSLNALGLVVPQATIQTNYPPTRVDHAANTNTAETSVNQIYTDVVEYQVGAAGDGAGAGNLTIKRLYEMKNIGQGTILAMDKDLYFGQDLYLRLWLAPANKIAWTADSAVPNNTPVALASNITFSNVYMYLATESNIIIQDSVKAKVASGMTIQVPYLTSYRFGVSAPTLASSVSANVVINLNSANGRRLKNVLWSVFDGSETANRVYCCSNASSTVTTNKLLTYQTYVNNQPETDFVLDLSQNDDWRENRKRCSGTLIGSTLTHYKFNWFHMSRYGSLNDVDDIETYDNNIVDGIDLSAPCQYTIQATTGYAPANSYNLSGYSLYAFVQTQKELTITPQGVVFA